MRGDLETDPLRLAERTEQVRSARLIALPVGAKGSRVFLRPELSAADRHTRAAASSQISTTAKAGGDGAARRRLDEAKIRRFQDAIAAGIAPAAVVESINQAQADRAVVQAELASVGEPAGLSEAEVYAMVDSLGDIGAALTDSEPGKLAQLYRDLALDLRFDHEKEAVDLTASPRVNNVCVRGGT